MTFAPNIFHISIDEECDYTRTFINLDHLTGLPVDLTGYRAEIQVRVGENGDFANSYSNFVAALVFNTDTSAIVLGGAAGTIIVTIPYSSTYQLQWREATYSLMLISPTGIRTEFLRGFFVVQPNSSKLGTSTLIDQNG